MTGLIRGDCVIVPDEREANRIYGRGYYGTPQSGGALKLNLIEALYLLESGRLEVTLDEKKVGFDGLLGYASRTIPSFEIYYTVYRDMRQRGYVVKDGSPPFRFRVLPRGGTPTKTPTRYWLSAFSERAAFELNSIIEMAERAGELRKKLLLAIVDEEGDLTYYQADMTEPEGDAAAYPSGETEAYLSQDRVAVTDSERIEKLIEAGFFGKKVGPYLQLSLIESVYLMENGVCTVRRFSTGRKASVESVKKLGRKLQPDFDLRMEVYRDLKERGLITKTGLKYGTHFRAYEGDPDHHHARFLVHCFEDGYKGLWPDISGAVRLAHGVRKEMLFARVSGGRVDYLRLRRKRP